MGQGWSERFLKRRPSAIVLLIMLSIASVARISAQTSPQVGTPQSNLSPIPAHDATTRSEGRITVLDQANAADATRAQQKQTQRNATTALGTLASDAQTKAADVAKQLGEKARPEQARYAAEITSRNAAILTTQPPGEKPQVERTKNDCPLGQDPPVIRAKGSFVRPTVGDDFLVLEYNADPGSLETRWYDYRQWSLGRTGWSNGYTVERNGTFLPVVWAKEKILVHVCGLHFTDIVTVSNDSTGLPEGGADIRGGTPVTTIPTLTPALDSIQAIGATGQAASIGGLGYGATPALTTSAATGVTPGTVTHGPTGLSYNDAVITASPKELALLMYALIENGLNLSDTIQKNFVVSVDVGHNTPEEFETYAPTSSNHIALELQQRLTETYNDISGAQEVNPAAFDRDMTNVQNLSTEMTNFFGSLSSQGYGTRAVTLWNNYALLRAPLNMMEDHLEKQNCIPPSEAQAAASAADLAAEAYVEAEIAEAVAQKKLSQASAADRPKLQADLNARHAATQTAQQKLADAQTKAIQKADSTTPSNQPINCDDWEAKNYAAFLDEYHADLYQLAARDPRSAYQVLHWHPAEMFEDLSDLQQSLENMTGTVGQLYSMLNLWNDYSEAEQSDFITPVAGNALERISISVQHGYVPFTLSRYATSTAPTLTTPPAPTISTAASTSTPAHAVKTILVEVHRRANLNLIGGAMFLRVPTSTYAVQVGTPAALVNANPTPVITTTTNSSGTTTTYSYTFVYDGNCNGSTGAAGTTTVNVSTTMSNPNPPGTPAPPAAPGYTCVVQTQTGKTQVAGMAGADWFILGRDYFPLRDGAGFSPRNLVPALYAATSVTSLGNASFGLNFEPFNGVDILLGAGMAHTTILPTGVTTSTIEPSGYTLPGVTQVNWGFTYGFGFDLSIISQIFSKGPSSASLP